MSDSIHLKLPDGSTKEVAKGATALDVAKSINPRLADAALAAVRLAAELEQDAVIMGAFGGRHRDGGA